MRVGVLRVDAQSLLVLRDGLRQLALFRQSVAQIAVRQRVVWVQSQSLLVLFDGAEQMHCDLTDGPCTDLNLMVADSAGAISARVQSVQKSFSVQDPRRGVLPRKA